MQELEIYTAGNQQYRSHIDPIEISLEKIRRAVFVLVGWKNSDKPAELEKKIERTAMSKVTKVTKDAKDAWIAAGMPSPANEWFRNYREHHG